MCCHLVVKNERFDRVIKSCSFFFPDVAIISDVLISSLTLTLNHFHSINGDFVCITVFKIITSPYI